MRILYICPLIPSASGNGGRRAAYNHLLDLGDETIQIDAVLVDVEESRESLPVLSSNINARVFSRAIPKFNSGYRAKIVALLEHFINRLPRAVRVIASKEAREFIQSALKTQCYDAIVMEHLNAYGLICGIKTNVPLIYIAHNVEAAVLEDQISQISRWKPTRMLRKMDIGKVVSLELELCRAAKGIVLISSTDSAIPPMPSFHDKLAIWPELPTPKTSLWQPNNHKRLLFVGSAKYFPNRDAIEWLAGTLLPRLRQSDPAITLNIAGTAINEINQAFHTQGVHYLGFVSESELERLHVESTLFICPVVLGGGIKIKVLEASSYGIPIVATSESLNGIEYLSEHAIRFARDSCTDIENIHRLLSDINELTRISNATIVALNNARDQRVTLKRVITCMAN